RPAPLATGPASPDPDPDPRPAAFAAPPPPPPTPAPMDLPLVPRPSHPDFAPPALDPQRQLARAVEHLRLHASKLAEQARADALEIGFLVARRILELELSTGPEPLFALVKSAVRKLGDARRVVLKLHPDDATQVETSEARQRLGLTLLQVEVVPDGTLARGDCIVESDAGVVDGTLATRLEELKRGVAAALGAEDRP
ncbi:MAG: flagellar assembly protein FliH, partial [Myxococcaceae bacterium]|nr:flagellar assembly protein FliH [Myxococcaceae bacterium]